MTNTWNIKTVEAAEEYRENLLAKTEPKENYGALDKFLDFFRDGVSIGARNEEEAKADAIILKAQAEANAIRRGRMPPSQHVHIHMDKEEVEKRMRR